MNYTCLAAMTLVFAATPRITAATTIETVVVGNPGNAPDQSYGLAQGAVDYRYRIGKYEVTTRQYAEFLNAVDPQGVNEFDLWTLGMDYGWTGGIDHVSSAHAGEKYLVQAGWDESPATFITWYSAIRFANWMHNGQGGPGTTETGAYTLIGGTVIPSNGDSIVRNLTASWFLPSEDEWYKAAYHQPAALGGDDDDYWLYPTAANSVPFSDQPPGTDAPEQANTGNFLKNDYQSNGYDDGFAVLGLPDNNRENKIVSDVGAYSFSSSFYGTFDQGGNVYEWTEQLVDDQGIRHIGRGGSYETEHHRLAASSRLAIQNFPPGYRSVGFRLATVVPEPSSGILWTLCGIGIYARRWATRKHVSAAT